MKHKRGADEEGRPYKVKRRGTRAWRNGGFLPKRVTTLTLPQGPAWAPTLAKGSPVTWRIEKESETGEKKRVNAWQNKPKWKGPNPLTDNGNGRKKQGDNRRRGWKLYTKAKGNKKGGNWGLSV